MAWNNQKLIPITIRVEQHIIDDFKKESQHDMIDKGKYQKLINRVLKAWSSGREMPARYIPERKKAK